MPRRDDANGPIILWLDYGCEGWKPTSFDTVKEALEADRYSADFRVTRLVDYQVYETGNEVKHVLRS